MTSSRFRQRMISSIAWLFRFRTLQLAEFAYGPGHLRHSPQESVHTPLFGATLPLVVSRSVTHRLLCVEGERFIHEREVLRSLLKPGDVVIDVGANVGYLSLLFLQAIGRAGKLICVEPDTDNFEELSQCMRVNDLTDVVLIQAAVGDSPGVVQLSPGLNGHITEHGSMTVPQITLDSLAPYRPDVIKIDVEGYEECVIDGAMDILQESSPTLFLELHPYLVPGRADIRRILEKLDSVYDRIEFVEYRLPRRFTSKLLMRYGLESAVTTMSDREELLRQIEAGNRDQPFWAICQRSQ